MRLVLRFAGAIFWNGTRRYVAVTGPSIVLGTVALMLSQGSPTWKPEWWMWTLAALCGLVIASYLAWREQFLAILELVGRPELTLKVAEVHYFIARNSNEHAAVNVTAHEIVLDVPASIAAQYSATSITSSSDADAEPSPPAQWRVNFVPIDSLIALDNNSHGRPLDYTIWGVMEPYNRQLGTCLGALSQSTDAQLALAFLLSFSNLGSPKRTWHSHYDLSYSMLQQTMILKHIATAEVTHENKCSRCN